MNPAATRRSRNPGPATIRQLVVLQIAAKHRQLAGGRTTRVLTPRPVLYCGHCPAGTVIMKRLLLTLLKAYQYLLSPWLGPRCRFYPSCSEYARQAVILHGAGRGSWLAARRVCRCHPWHPGGLDPVPGTEEARHDG